MTHATESTDVHDTIQVQTPPQLRFAFEIEAQVRPPHRIGHEGGGLLLFTPIVGGTVSGPRLNGTVLAGGGDWSVTRAGVATDLDARYLIQAEDGAVIDIVNRGFWVADPEVERILEGGGRVDPSRYYFRTQPVFRTAAPDHVWLTRTVFVGVAYDEILDSETIRIAMFEVL